MLVVPDRGASHSGPSARSKAPEQTQGWPSLPEGSVLRERQVQGQDVLGSPRYKDRVLDGPRERVRALESQSNFGFGTWLQNQ